MILEMIQKTLECYRILLNLLESYVIFNNSVRQNVVRTSLDIPGLLLFVVEIMPEIKSF